MYFAGGIFMWWVCDVMMYEFLLPPDVPYSAPAYGQDLSNLNLSKSTTSGVSSAGSRSSKTEILRVTRGRLHDKESPSHSHQVDNKRKRNSSRENSLESLLEEEDPLSEECSAESLGQQNENHKSSKILQMFIFGNQREDDVSFC